MTKTANVHFNLSAWANASYTVGQRVSNAGNAYQCIVPGSSTAAPTGTGVAINNGGVAIWTWLTAIDYTTLSAWQADTANYPLILTQPYVVNVWSNGAAIGMTTSAGTPYFQLTGHTTSVSNTITIQAAPGESLRDTLKGQNTALAVNAALGATFQAPTTGTWSCNWFYITDQNVTLDGLCFLDTQAADISTLVQFGAAGVRMQNCFIDGFVQGGGASLIGGDSITGALTLVNCVVINRDATSQGVTFLSNYTVTTVLNCTMVATAGSTSGGCVNNVGAMTVRNTIMISFGAATVIGSNGTAAVDHSLFSAALLSGANVTTGAGNFFTRTASSTFNAVYTDLRLRSNSVGVDAGQTDTTNNPAADDIARTPRPVGAAWDIGAWEYFATPAGFSPQVEQTTRLRPEMIPY